MPETIVNAFHAYVDIKEVAVVLFIVFPVLFFVIWLIFLKWKMWRRLAKNCKREIIIFSSGSEDMKIETDLLRATEFFKITKDPFPNHALQITANCLVIIGYSDPMENFDKILREVETRRLPVIIYSKKRLPDDITNRIKEYPLHSICQTPLRLISDVFAILSTFPNKYAEEK